MSIVTKSRTEEVDDGEEQEPPLHSVIRHFLFQSNDYMFGDRIHKLVFIADVFCTEEYSSRLTTADFKPTMYGPYSPDISVALENMDDLLDTKFGIYDGQKEKKYLWDEPEFEEGSPKDLIIGWIYDTTEAFDRDELIKVSKLSELFQDANYDEVMNFGQYRSSLESDDHDVTPVHVEEIGTEDTWNDDERNIREHLHPVSTD